jgi:hypothetical protein
MPGKYTLDSIADRYSLYMVERKTKGGRLQPPFLIILEPEMFWPAGPPVIVDTFHNEGDAAIRIRNIAKRLDKDSRWQQLAEEPHAFICKNNVRLVEEHNFAIFKEEEKRKVRPGDLGRHGRRS